MKDGVVFATVHLVAQNFAPSDTAVAAYTARKVDAALAWLDRPMLSSVSGLQVENFSRIEAFGHPFTHWIRVRVKPGSQQLFNFEPMIIPENVIPSPLPD